MNNKQPYFNIIQKRCFEGRASQNTNLKSLSKTTDWAKQKSDIYYLKTCQIFTMMKCDH